jgi:hypothetical protein
LSTPLQRIAPSSPIKPTQFLDRTVLSRLNLIAQIFDSMSTELVPMYGCSLPAITSTSTICWKQVPMTSFFDVKPSTTVLPPAPPPSQQQSKPKQTTVCRVILQYSKPKKPLNKITRYTTSLPTYDLFDSWGHSLERIDANNTFRVLLQNPNGLPIHRNNQLLIQDLQTCYNYVAGVLCFPETKTNWNQESQ